MSPELPVVAALDGSAESELALQEAAAIAKHREAPLLILGVLAPPMTPLGGPIMVGSWYEETVREFQSVLDRARSSVEAMQLRSCTTLLLRGPVVESIVSYLEQNPARLIVVGARGRSAFSRYLLGSVSEGLVHHAPCSILVVRPPKSSAPSRAGAGSPPP